MTRQIKYYRNRKMYDTIESKYTNQIELIARIKNGEDIQVVSNESGLDITPHALTEALKNMDIPSDKLIELIIMHEIKQEL